MRAPAYHLRPNKSIDRLVFIDAIRQVQNLAPLGDYTYYGFGGPYLEDFRLIYEFHPAIRMVSIERSSEVLKRQRFHLPCGTVQLKRGELSSFVTNYEARDEPSIFWLDYTDLSLADFDIFSALIPKLVSESIVKVTFRAEWRDYLNRKPDDKKPEEFRAKFGALMPDPLADPPQTTEGYVALLQSMLQIAAERALPAATGMAFQPICTFYYSDGTFMFTATGVVCKRSRRKVVREAFREWQFASLNWAKARRIDVPTLTTKERLALQERLPCSRRAGSTLRRALGYLVDDGRRKTEARLKQYAQFHRYYPYVMRGIP